MICPDLTDAEGGNSSKQTQFLVDLSGPQCVRFIRSQLERAEKPYRSRLKYMTLGKLKKKKKRPISAAKADFLFSQLSDEEKRQRYLNPNSLRGSLYDGYFRPARATTCKNTIQLIRERGNNTSKQRSWCKVNRADTIICRRNLKKAIRLVIEEQFKVSDFDVYAASGKVYRRDVLLKDSADQNLEFLPPSMLFPNFESPVDLLKTLTVSNLDQNLKSKILTTFHPLEAWFRYREKYKLKVGGFFSPKKKKQQDLMDDGDDLLSQALSSVLLGENEILPRP